jgi:hypothetical protein
LATDSSAADGWRAIPDASLKQRIRDSLVEPGQGFGYRGASEEDP